MAPRFLDASVENFVRMFRRFRAEVATKKFILFLADKDPDSNLSWCHDCNVAEEMIYEMALDSPDDILLLRAYVGDRRSWLAHLHPFRTNPLFPIINVPTLILWENDSVAGRLERYESQNPFKIFSLLA